MDRRLLWRPTASRGPSGRRATDGRRAGQDIGGRRACSPRPATKRKPWNPGTLEESVQQESRVKTQESGREPSCCYSSEDRTLEKPIVSHSRPETHRFSQARSLHESCAGTHPYPDTWLLGYARLAQSLFSGPPTIPVRNHQSTRYPRPPALLRRPASPFLLSLLPAPEILFFLQVSCSIHRRRRRCLSPTRTIHCSLSSPIEWSLPREILSLSRSSPHSRLTNAGTTPLRSRFLLVGTTTFFKATAARSTLRSGTVTVTGTGRSFSFLSLCRCFFLSLDTTIPPPPPRQPQQQPGRIGRGPRH